MNELVAVLGERLKRSRYVIVGRIDGHLGREVFQAILEGFGIEIAGAFIEHPGGERRNPGLALRVLSSSPGEAKLQAQDRSAMILDKPSLYTFFADDFLNLHGACWKCGPKKQRQNGCRSNHRLKKPAPNYLSYHVGSCAP